MAHCEMNSTMEEEEEEEEEEKKERNHEWECFVVIHNIAKRHNIGTMIRSASAFRVSEFVLVGRRDFNSFGSHGSSSHLPFRHFYSLSEAKYYLKEEKGCDICGVEIAEGAFPIQNHPFKRSTAFFLGNEGTGLSSKESEICDFFVYIPQYGSGTASLNVTVAASIVLHHFGVWARFAERNREGNKYVVAKRLTKEDLWKLNMESAKSIAEERKNKREVSNGDVFDEIHDSCTVDDSHSNGLDGLFSS